MSVPERHPDEYGAAAEAVRAAALKTPAYVVDEALLARNLRVLADVRRRCGAKILLAQKAFSMFRVYPQLAGVLDGTAASGLYEARLGHEEFGGETHVFSPAYRADEFGTLLHCADHIVFNSFSQWRRFGPRALKAGKACGLRVNPECSTQEDRAIYDPCAPFSRLGVTAENWEPGALGGITGLHMHTLCEQNADALETTVRALEEKFGPTLRKMRWLNLGGGHHITRADYDTRRLCRIITHLRETYGLEVYLEPGEAVALDAGFLAATVLDVVHNGMDVAILDASAACHMPDVLEMPYRPPVVGAGKPGEAPHTVRLTGPTCLAGDVIGDYAFEKPLRPGDRVVFGDMAIYTMVKNNTFNGMRLPDIVLRRADGRMETVRRFGFADFKHRLS